MIQDFERNLDDATVAQPVYPMDRPSIPDNVLPSVDPGSSYEEQGNPFASMPAPQLIDMEICDMVINRKRASEDDRQVKKLVWDKCWDHFRNVYDKTGKEAWQSTTFQPDTAKVVETIAANLHAAVLGPDVPIEWQCKVKQYESIVRSINDIQKTDFANSKAKVHYTDIIRSLCIVGTGIGKIGYRKEKDIVMVKKRGKVSVTARAMAAFMGQPAPVAQDTYSPEEMLVKDYANVEYRDLYKIFPEPGTTDIDKDHWIIEMSKVTNRELMALARAEDETQRIREVPPDVLMRAAKDSDQTNPDLQARRIALQQSSSSPLFFDPDTPHDLFEYWGPVPVWMVYPEKRNDEASKYEMVNAWIWVIDGIWVARAQLMPYRDAAPPYVKSTYIRIPGDWYGVGPAELMLGLQIDKNETVNTGSDQTNLSLNKVVAILKDKVPPDCWNRLVSKPGAQWLFEGIQRVGDAIQVIEFPPLTRDWYMKIQMIDAAIQEVTAANKVTLGAGGGGDESGGGTFRGQLLNKQTANERFMLYSRVFEQCGLADAYRKMYQRIYQFKDYEAVTNIIGEERAAKFEFIPPEQLEQIASLVPLGVLTMETKGVKLAQMTEWAKVFGAQPWAKMYDLARRMWIEMGYSDPDSVTFSEEEMQQFNQFRRELMAETSQGPMAGGSPAGGPPGAPGGAPGEAPMGPPPGPVAGNVPGPTDGMPMAAMPARGPGASSIDVSGRPMG